MKTTADSVLLQEILKHHMELSGANFKYHRRTSHFSHPFALLSSVYHNIKNTWKDRRNFILKIRELLQVLAQLFLVSVLFHVLHSILAKITWGGEGRKPEMFQSVTFKVTGLLWITSLSNLVYNEGFPRIVGRSKDYSCAVSQI